MGTWGASWENFRRMGNRKSCFRSRKGDANPIKCSQRHQVIMIEWSRRSWTDSMTKPPSPSKAYPRTYLDLKNWINDALGDIQWSAPIGKESVDGGTRETRKDLKHLRKYLTGVDAFLKARFPNPQDTSLQTTHSETTYPRTVFVAEGTSGAAANSGAPPDLGSRASSSKVLPPTQSQDPQGYSTVFSTTIHRVRPGATRVEINDSEHWKARVLLPCQTEARTVRYVGSLVFLLGTSQTGWEDLGWENNSYCP